MRCKQLQLLKSHNKIHWLISFYPQEYYLKPVPLFSGGLHDREIIDLDLVASLRVGGIQLPALDIWQVIYCENPYISLGPKNGKKITLPGSKSSSLGGYFHYLGMITALEDSSNPRDEPWWIGLWVQSCNLPQKTQYIVFWSIVNSTYCTICVQIVCNLAEEDDSLK